jgi:hypothetical protein
VIVSDRGNAPLRQSDEIEPISLCPVDQIPIVITHRKHVFIISAEREKMMLSHSDAATGSIRPLAAESMNDGIRIVLPESSPGFDRIADEVVRIEIDDIIPGGREVSEVLFDI